ncbi:MAG TPA: ABC transporter ATP-binding protein [Candidatus Binatia bacterium]|nr:ABC transporter ATP-binding protein [Candidatus Binatia bacterium]
MAARRDLAWLAGFVWPERRRLAGVLALSLAASGLALVQPWLTRPLIDEGLLAGRLDVVLRVAAALAALAVLAAAAGAANQWLYVSTSARVLFALREAVYRHLTRLSPAFYARARTGDLVARLDGDVADVQRFAVDTLLASVNGAIVLAGAVAFMVSLSWQLSLVALVLLPVELAALRVLRGRVERLARPVRERASDLTSFLVDTLAAMKLVQSVAAEARETQRLRTLHARFLDDLLRLQLASYAAAAVPGVLTSLTAPVVWLAGGAMVVAGRLSLGTLVAFAAYLARATGPVQTLLGVWVAARRARVSLERVGELLAEAPAVAPPGAPRRLPADARGEVRFEGVVFRHEGREGDVLAGVTATIPAGAKAGIVGASGAGKTTLVDLLHRHFDPAAGRVLLDGVDVRDLDLAELRRRVAVVAQDAVLFTGTIADNIRYAAPEADDAAVRAAAARAELDELLARLPEGLDAEVGARGTALSGGERQRIAIARALLQDPLALVLDEATSAIDIATQARIGATIDRLFADRTRLVVSHRPEALAGVDMVLEVAAGRLVPAPPPVRRAAR